MSSTTFLKKSLAERKEEVHRLMKKFYNKIPVVLRHDRRSHLPTLRCEKLLVDDYLTVGQFLFLIRQRIALSSSEAIYIFFGGEMVPISYTMKQVYALYHDRYDEMLYAMYSTESTFG